MMEMFVDDGFLRFDGEVVEWFTESGRNDRYHVRYLAELKLYEGRKGTTLMDLKYGKGAGSGFRGFIVPAEEIDRAHEFVQAVYAAMQQAGNIR